MKVTSFPCGPAANESELKAFEHLKYHLQSSQGKGEWVLLTNLTLSVNNQLQSDEIDVVTIGNPGVRVIEIKHWAPQWIDSHSDLVEQEAERVANKARKIGTTLRAMIPHLPRVDGAILLTQETAKMRRFVGKSVRGIRFYTLNDWQNLLELDYPQVLAPNEIMKLVRRLEPKTAVAIDGSIRRLAGYVNLELQTPKEDRFHRVYKGSHSARQDRVILHLYDLSAGDEKNAEVKARREFDALHRLQIYPWAPRILDSFQDAPGYSGEMYFFTLIDPAAPSSEKRSADATWDTAARLAFSRDAIAALKQLHESGQDGSPMIHRNLSPKTILVKYDNSPILTGFERTKISSELSVISAGSTVGKDDATAAPEVRSEGLASADQRSDIYSACASLGLLFQESDSESNKRILETLNSGMAERPEDRPRLEELVSSLAALMDESVPNPPPPAARFWTEEQVIPFRDRDYRIVALLGTGGVGATFKVVETDRLTKEDLGTYVAKVAHNEEGGRRALKAYSVVRPCVARHADLSAVFEVATRDWSENEFVALMTWIEGSPFGDFTGVFPLLAEEQQEESTETLALRWLKDMCESLGVLHRNGLIHGDVSPRNMIVSGSNLVLTDYDCVTKIGDSIPAPGTVLYCSPSYQNRQPASPPDDFYALAASFFHVVFEKEPFQYGGARAKERGLNWENIDREEYSALADFLDKATSPNPAKRILSADEALVILNSQKPAEADTTKNLQQPINQVTDESGHETELPTQPSENRVDWLLSLLQSYPGSRWGNRETRGLDTTFAELTYVPTNLEESLLEDIQQRKTRLIILCGNAGDGKTALLQHLALRLGLGHYSSAERILKGQTEDGLTICMNLDGSAAWQGRSADEIVDDFLAPFQAGPSEDDIVHLLAINDGRLLEWIERAESQGEWNKSPLIEELGAVLEEKTAGPDSFIRLVSLNQRSLVGGITPDLKRIQTDFLDRLLDHLYGAEKSSEIWAPCASCSAMERCEVVRALRVFGPTVLPGMARESVRARARQRLFEALQAVHVRGETHITVRELRAALVYILFGTHFCEDYHTGGEGSLLPYWDRAFLPDSPDRQGEVLRELGRYDPALEAHPQIDRYIMSSHAAGSTKTAPRYEDMTVESARRRAYFEWTEEQVAEVARDKNALDLTRGQHLRLFRTLPLENSEMDSQQRLEACRRLCGGISRLEDLPAQALRRPGVVPLRITPRTPTETAFWVEKPLAAFRLEAELAADIRGIDRLHRQAFLIYRYRNGLEERLRLGAELFYLLLELGEGYQLGDVSTDDTFAHLSIFVQRLVREDEREIWAWNPMDDETIYKISATLNTGPKGARQRVVLNRAVEGGTV